MRVTVDLKFKIEGSDRIHHLYFPAILKTDDNCLETKDMKLEGATFEGITVDCVSETITNMDQDMKHYDMITIPIKRRDGRQIE